MAEEVREYKVRLLLCDFTDMTEAALTRFTHRFYTNRTERETHYIEKNLWSFETCYYDKRNRENPKLPKESDSEVKKLLRTLDDLDLCNILPKTVDDEYPWGSSLEVKFDQDVHLEVRIFDYSLLTDFAKGFTIPVLRTYERSYRMWGIQHRGRGGLLKGWTKYFDKFFDEAKLRINDYYNRGAYLLEKIE